MEDASPWTAIDWSAHAYVARVAGTKLRYIDRGRGPVVLLVHGMAGSWKTWLANIPALSERYRVIAVDLPGFGDSDPLPDGAQFEDYARALEQMLDVLEIREVAVVGHSLGGLISLSLAERAPDRVRCVLLVSGGGAELSRARLIAIQAAFWLFRIVLLLPGVGALGAHTSFGRVLLAPAVHDWRALPRDLFRELIPRSITSGFMDAVRLGGRGLQSIRLDGISAPTLLVWGACDRILPLAIAHKLQESLATSRLVVIEGAGHCAMLEKPEQFDRIALQFLELQIAEPGTPPNLIERAVNAVLRREAAAADLPLDLGAIDFEPPQAL